MYLDDKVLLVLDEYRRNHKATTGKMITRLRAIGNIIMATASDIVPEKALHVRLFEIEEDVRKLQERVGFLELRLQGVESAK
jgi:hypothetical protein